MSASTSSLAFVRKPLSLRKLAANRANALRSTGPRTAPGKLVVSQNALKHGLCTQRSVLPGDSEVDYDQLSEELRRDLRPKTPLQNLLLNRIVAVQWKLIRLQDAELQLYELESIKAAPAEMSDGATQMTNDKGQMTIPRTDSPAQPARLVDDDDYAERPLYNNMFPCEVLARRFSDDPDNGFILLHRYDQALQREFRSLLTRFHQVQKIWPTTPYDDDDVPVIPRPRAFRHTCQKQTQTHQSSDSATPVESATCDPRALRDIVNSAKQTQTPRALAVTNSKEQITNNQAQRPRNIDPPPQSSDTDRRQ